MADFIASKTSQLKHSSNLSISIMSLSDVPLIDENANDYNNLCKTTKEGLYVNIVDKGLKADWLAE